MVCASSGLIELSALALPWSVWWSKAFASYQLMFSLIDMRRGRIQHSMPHLSTKLRRRQSGCFMEGECDGWRRQRAYRITGWGVLVGDWQ